jgi:hypothetical protein
MGNTSFQPIDFDGMSTTIFCVITSFDKELDKSLALLTLPPLSFWLNL